MADPRAFVQVSLLRDGGLPEDVVVNNWSFEGDDDPLSSDRENWDSLTGNLFDRIEAFYQGTQTFLSQVLSGTGIVKMYDASDAQPRIPRFEETFGFAPGSSAVPSEVALVISLQAAAESGANMRRRRGRVYFGPLSAAAATTVGSTGPNDVRPSASTRQTIAANVGLLATSGSNNFRLAVFSPTTAGLNPMLDAAWNDVERIWVDDAFDTQRRRGARATTRTIFDWDGDSWEQTA